MAIRRTAPRDKNRKIESHPMSFRLYADCRAEFNALVRASDAGREGTVCRELISEALMQRRLKRLARTVQAAAREDASEPIDAPDLEPADSILSGLNARLDRLEASAAAVLEASRNIDDRIDVENERLESISRFGAQTSAQAAALLWTIIRTHPEFAGRTDVEFAHVRSTIEGNILEQLEAVIETGSA